MQFLSVSTKNSSSAMQMLQTAELRTSLVSQLPTKHVMRHDLWGPSWPKWEMPGQLFAISKQSNQTGPNSQMCLCSLPRTQVMTSTGRLQQVSRHRDRAKSVRLDIVWNMFEQNQEVPCWTGPVSNLDLGQSAPVSSLFHAPYLSRRQ